MTLQFAQGFYNYQSQFQQDIDHIQFQISQDGQYLALVMIKNQLPYIQIIDLQNVFIIQIITLQKCIDIRKSIIRFSYDLKFIHIASYDTIYCISLRNKSQSKINSRNYPIQDIIDDKNKCLIVLTKDRLKIIKNGKIIKKFRFQLDYSPIHDKILIYSNKSIILVQKNIIDYFCFKNLDKAFFLQNSIITLDVEGLELWDICKQKETYILIKRKTKYFSSSAYQEQTSIELNRQQNIIILVRASNIFLFDSDLKLQKQVNICDEMPGKIGQNILSSKIKLYYLDYNKKKIYVFFLQRDDIIRYSIEF